MKARIQALLIAIFFAFFAGCTTTSQKSLTSDQSSATFTGMTIKFKANRSGIESTGEVLLQAGESESSNDACVIPVMIALSGDDQTLAEFFHNLQNQLFKGAPTQAQFRFYKRDPVKKVTAEFKTNRQEIFSTFEKLTPKSNFLYAPSGLALSLIGRNDSALKVTISPDSDEEKNNNLLQKKQCAAFFSGENFSVIQKNF